MGTHMEWSARTRRQEERFPLRGAACVVEPDDALREHMAESLRRMGYTTHETASGAVGDFMREAGSIRRMASVYLIDRLRGPAQAGVAILGTGAGGVGLT